MKLKDLINGFAETNLEIEVTGLTLDSRQVCPGYVFFAMSGVNQHGFQYIKQAHEKGASVIIYDPKGLEGMNTTEHESIDIPLISIDLLDKKIGLIASCFYGEPSKKIQVIGITGTNGKTSCSQFLGQSLDRCGIIGTLGWGEWQQLKQTENTTPDAISLQKMMKYFVDNGMKSVAMEVSSHGLTQGRVEGISFTAGLITNISRDHLDYHGSMENYLLAKLKLLQAENLKFAVMNADDAYIREMKESISQEVGLWFFSLNGNLFDYEKSVLISDVRSCINGTTCKVTWQSIQKEMLVQLYGDYNIENAAAVLTVMLALGIEFEEAIGRVSNLKPIKGRMEFFGGQNAPLIFVDYAHTPDALEKVLSGLKKCCKGKLTVVFGCGGNRDVGKRSQMGRVAEQWADEIILTDDNPRFEASNEIIDAIKSECAAESISILQNRELAIKTAIEKSAPNDCVVIAGKGHEQYQEVMGIKRPFSDQLVVQSILESWSTCH